MSVIHLVTEINATKAIIYYLVQMQSDNRSFRSLNAVEWSKAVIGIPGLLTEITALLVNADIEALAFIWSILYAGF